MSPGTDEEGAPFSLAELAAWRGFLQTHAVVTSRLAADMEASAGLTLAESEVLLKLAISSTGCLPLAQLGTKTYVTLSASGLSRLVDRLRRRGWVTREPERDGDRRSANVIITEQGRQVWAGAATRHQALVRETFLARLDPEQLTQLEAIWARLLADEPPIFDEPDQR